MIVYYVNSSMFFHHAYSEEMLYRFKEYINEHPCDLILVSGSDVDPEVFESFIDFVVERQIGFYISPMNIDLGIFKGVLDDVTLQLEGHPLLVAMSGMVIKIVVDEVIHSQKIYFEMFANETLVELEDQFTQRQLEIMEELDRLHGDQFKKKRKKKYH